MGSFNNMGISSLWIDGKPVKRASLGGKVFYAKHDYNLSLTSDKDILSFWDNDVATLTATLTDDGEPVEGENVVWSGALFSTTIGAAGDSGIEVDIGDEYILHITGQDVTIGSGPSVILIGGQAVTIFVNQRPIFEDSYNTDGSFNPRVVNNTLIFTNANGVEVSYDVSGFDVSKLTITYQPTPLEVERDNVNCTTDSNGECSVSYDSKGTGDLNIKCEIPERMIVSETYGVEDCVFYDDATVDKSSHYSYFNPSKIGRLVYGDNEYYTTVEQQNKGHVPLKIIELTDNFIFEIETKGYNSLNHSITLHKSPTEYLAYNIYSNYILKYLYPSEQKQGSIITPFGNINSYHRFRIEKQGNQLTLKVYSDNSLTCTDTYTLPSNYQNIPLTICTSPYGYETYRYNEVTFRKIKVTVL